MKKKQTTKTDINKATNEALAELIRQDFSVARTPLRWSPNMAQLSVLREEKRMLLITMGRRGYIPEEILNMFRPVEWRRML